MELMMVNLERWAALPSDWTGVKAVDTPAHSHSKNRWSPEQEARVAGNYAAGWHMTPEHQRLQGAQFFPVWNKDALHLGGALAEAGLTHPSAQSVDVGASVLSHLSPKNESEKNRIQAYQLTDLLVQHGTQPFAKHLAPMADALSKRNEYQKVLDDGLKARTIKKGSADHHELLGLINHHQAIADVHRLSLGLSYHGSEGQILKTPLADVGSREIGAAVSSVSHPEPLTTLGTVKRRSFGEDIADPFEERGPRGRTADTHIFDLGVGATDIPYSVDRRLDAQNRYNQFSRLVNVGHEMAGTQAPRTEFMAGNWVGHQFRKIAANPDAAQARRAAGTQIERMLSTSQFQQWLPQTHGMAPVSNKFAGA